MSKDFFRKAALERLSSPEQLDAMIKITSPISWAGLIILGVIIAGTLLWGVYGSIPSRVTAQGVLHKNDGAVLIAVLYFQPEKAMTIKKDMKALVSPSALNPEEHGFILGRVLRVSDTASSKQRMDHTLQNKKWSDHLSMMGAVIEVHIELLTDQHTDNTYKWSSPDGTSSLIEKGMFCSAIVTIDEHPPISLVFPLLKKRLTGTSQRDDIR